MSLKSNNADGGGVINQVKKLANKIFDDREMIQANKKISLNKLSEGAVKDYKDYRSLLLSDEGNDVIDKMADAVGATSKASEEAVNQLDNNLERLQKISQRSKYSDNEYRDASVYTAALATNGSKLSNSKLRKMYEEELKNNSSAVNWATTKASAKDYFRPSRLNGTQMVGRYGTAAVGIYAVGGLASSFRGGDEY